SVDPKGESTGRVIPQDPLFSYPSLSPCYTFQAISFILLIPEPQTDLYNPLLSFLPLNSLPDLTLLNIFAILRQYLATFRKILSILFRIKNKPI
ncbi:hypothetical protein ACXKU5_003973, partial [Yersinia enterocolitica]